MTVEKIEQWHPGDQKLIQIWVNENDILTVLATASLSMNQADEEIAESFRRVKESTQNARRQHEDGWNVRYIATSLAHWHKADTFHEAYLAVCDTYYDNEVRPFAVWQYFTTCESEDFDDGVHTEYYMARLSNHEKTRDLRMVASDHHYIKPAPIDPEQGARSINLRPMIVGRPKKPCAACGGMLNKAGNKAKKVRDEETGKMVRRMIHHYCFEEEQARKEQE